MPDLEQTEDRLRSELRTIDPGGVAVARVVATGHRRAWRRAARRGTVLGVGVAVLVGGGVFAVRLGDDQPDAMTASPDEIPDSTPTSPPSAIISTALTAWPAMGR